MIIISLPCICRVNSWIFPSPLWLSLFHLLCGFPFPFSPYPFTMSKPRSPSLFPSESSFTNFFQGIHNEWELLIVKRWCQQYPSSPWCLRTLSTDSKHALRNHYPGIWKTGNDIFPTWLINASTVWILNFSFYSILVSCIIFSVLGSLPYIPVATARCVTLVWVPLWPFTCVEI